MKTDYPQTPRRPVSETIGAVTFDDPYAWLQEDSPEALAWQERQDALAKQSAPSGGDFEKLLCAIQGEGSLTASVLGGVPQRLGGKWFRMASAPDGAGITIWVSDSLEKEGQARC